MRLHFDIDKTIAAAAYLMQRKGGELDMFLGLKSLYLGDKEALIGWGKTITGDSFRALPKGPVLWTVYKLFKGTASADIQAQWDWAFTDRMNHTIHLRNPVTTDSLSEREMEILAKAQDMVEGMAPWDVADFLHETCPEWEDPNGKSLPILPETILRNAGRTDGEIGQLSDSENVFQQTKILLGAR